ncbi:unnamed protein product, partial [Ectocarpus sp. 12 AP-2014]
RSHRREYGEPIPGRLLAERLGEFIHAACVRWGSRAYPNALFVACWGEGAPDTPASLRSEGGQRSSGSDAHVVVTGGTSVSESETEETAVVEKGGGGDEPVLHDDRQPVAEEGILEEEEGEEDDSDDGEGLVMDRDAGFQLYVVDPGGAVRRHRAACTGRGSSRARKWLHRRVTGAASAPAPGDEAASGGASGFSSSGSAEREREKNGGWSPEAGGRDDAAEEDGDDRSAEDHGGDGSGSGEDSDWRGTQSARGGGVRQRGRRRQQPPFSQMTCEEAGRAMVREARRVRAGELGKAGGRGGSEAVAGLPEVAWLSINRGGEPVFVHHRSNEDLYESGE